MLKIFAFNNLKSYFIYLITSLYNIFNIKSFIFFTTSFKYSFFIFSLSLSLSSFLSLSLSLSLLLSKSHQQIHTTRDVATVGLRGAMAPPNFKKIYIIIYMWIILEILIYKITFCFS